MAVELRLMRWAVEIAHRRSLRQAALALNVRQSTLSRALRNLEIELKTVLFERTNGGTRPTVEGQEFLNGAKRILEETGELVDRLRASSRRGSGRLAIGVHASFSAGNLRATLIEHRRRNPEVQIKLIDGTSERLISELAASIVDIAFIAEHHLRKCRSSLAVWSERVVVAIPEHHILSASRTIFLCDLRSEPLFLPQRGPGPELAMLLSAKLGGADGLILDQQDVSLDRLLTLVGAGMGILLALEGATGVSYPGVVFRELHTENGPIRLDFHAMWRQDDFSPPLQTLLDILRERYPDFSAEPTGA